MEIRFNTMIESLINSSLSKELITIILAMLPVAELRLSIPIAITVFHMPWYEAFGLGILGNMIPVPFYYSFLIGVPNWCRKCPSGKNLLTGS